jgi:amino acid transporter
LNSVIAGVQAGFNAGSRLMFSLGRSGSAPRRLAWVDRRRSTPAVAIAVMSILGIALGVIAARQLGGPYPAFIFFLTMLTILLIILYALMCVACAYYYAVKAHEQFSPLAHLVVPLLALAILAPTLYYSVKGLEGSARYAIPALAGWMGLGFVVLLVLVVRGTDISSEKLRWLREDQLALEQPELEPLG